MLCFVTLEFLSIGPYAHLPWNISTWLTFIGYMKDCLWSLDFFRCKSLRLSTHWVLVLTNQCVRWIIRFEVRTAILIDGRTLCRLFLRPYAATSFLNFWALTMIFYFGCVSCSQNLRILGIHEVKVIPNLPECHSFIKGLMGTILSGYLDQLSF